MGKIKETIPTLKRRNGVSEELKEVIRNLKKYQKITIPIPKRKNKVSKELKEVIRGLKKYQNKSFFNSRIFDNLGFADNLFDYGIFE